MGGTLAGSSSWGSRGAHQVNIVSDALPEANVNTGTVIGNIAKTIGADPKAPLTPSRRTGGSRRAAD